MISLKKYWDMSPDKPNPNSPKADNELAGVILESYRSALLAMGKSNSRTPPREG